jgi:hypothetical protein
MLEAFSDGELELIREMEAGNHSGYGDVYGNNGDDNSDKSWMSI